MNTFIENGEKMRRHITVSISVKGACSICDPCVFIENEPFVVNFIEERGFKVNKLDQEIDPVTLGILQAQLKPMFDLNPELQTACNDMQAVLDSLEMGDTIRLNYLHIVRPDYRYHCCEKTKPNQHEKTS